MKLGYMAYSEVTVSIGIVLTPVANLGILLGTVSLLQVVSELVVVYSPAIMSLKVSPMGHCMWA